MNGGEAEGQVGILGVKAFNVIAVEVSEIGDGDGSYRRGSSRSAGRVAAMAKISQRSEVVGIRIVDVGGIVVSIGDIWIGRAAGCFSLFGLGGHCRFESVEVAIGIDSRYDSGYRSREIILLRDVRCVAAGGRHSLDIVQALHGNKDVRQVRGNCRVTVVGEK